MMSHMRRPIGALALGLVIALLGTLVTLVPRVREMEEDFELRKYEQPGDRTLLDRAMTPFNRAASKRFLQEARYKVWRNAMELSVARRAGPEAYRARLRELEDLCRAKVEDLVRPGKVLVRLGLTGFGVLLGPPTVEGLANPRGWPENRSRTRVTFAVVTPV